MREDGLQRFERILLPHLPAAYNLARWLTRDGSDAEDVVQEACLRAFRSFDRYRGGDPRAWLLAIVRNTGYTWLRQNRRPDEAGDGAGEGLPDLAPDPETRLLQNADQERLRRALVALPLEFREVVVLRELEGLSYKEIADVADIPLGTVMSRLARARKQLQQCLGGRSKESAP